MFKRPWSYKIFPRGISSLLTLYVFAIHSFILPEKVPPSSLSLIDNLPRWLRYRPLITKVFFRLAKTEFELWTSHFESNCPTTWANTTAQCNFMFSKSCGLSFHLGRCLITDNSNSYCLHLDSQQPRLFKFTPHEVITCRKMG